MYQLWCRQRNNLTRINCNKGRISVSLTNLLLLNGAGNTRVVNQKEFEFFREELSTRLSSNYNVILKERKLPMSLLNDHQKVKPVDHVFVIQYVICVFSSNLCVMFIYTCSKQESTFFILSHFLMPFHQS